MGTTHRLHLTVALLLALTWVVPTRCSWGQTAERIGTGLVVEGSAEVQTQGVTTWESLRFRDAIFPNDTVRTRTESKVKVLLRDDSIMTLAENSEMQYTEFLLTPQQRRTVVSLTLGTLRVITARLFGSGSVTEVRTLNTVAGVRGTTFIVKFRPPDTTEVIALEGVVTVRNRAPTTQEIQPLPPNFLTQVVGDAPPSEAVAVSTDTLEQLIQEVHLIEQIPKEVLPSEELRALDTPRDSTRAPTVETRASELPAVVISSTGQTAPPDVVVREQPATLTVGIALQTSVVTPDTSIATSRVRVRLIFPGR